MKEEDLLKRLDKGIKTNAELFELLKETPPENWVKQHSEITGYRFLPIDKIEFLLKEIFKFNYRIEIIDHKQLFNTVSVVIRVHYKEFDTPFNWLSFDGGAAEEPEKNKGEETLKPFAVAAAFPATKSNAIRNACLSFGELFGANLNRLGYISNNDNQNQKTSRAKMLKKLKELFEEVKLKCEYEDQLHYQRIIDDEETENYSKAIKELETKKQ